MKSPQLDFKRVKQYLPHILLVGIGIGTANFIIHGEFNWLQWMIQSSATSFIVGFTLLWIASNKSVARQYLRKDWMLYPVLIMLFFLVGTIATEFESLIKSLIFLNNPYVPLSTIDVLVSNGIISIVLGFSFFLNNRLFVRQKENEEEVPEKKLGVEIKTITKIPVKQGENIQLVPTSQIVYFEAYDNYSHLHDSDGTKMLCDYSLIFLEKRLSNDFLRIHRKYIVNAAHIKQIVPHLNGRFLIEFNNPNLDTITSSKGYLKAMRKLVKIE